MNMNGSTSKRFRRYRTSHGLDTAMDNNPDNHVKWNFSALVVDDLPKLTNSNVKYIEHNYNKIKQSRKTLQLKKLDNLVVAMYHLTINIETTVIR